MITYHGALAAADAASPAGEVPNLNNAMIDLSDALRDDDPKKDFDSETLQGNVERPGDRVGLMGKRDPEYANF